MHTCHDVTLLPAGYHITAVNINKLRRLQKNGIADKHELQFYGIADKHELHFYGIGDKHEPHF
jgi:hypothetical protein